MWLYVTKCKKTVQKLKELVTEHGEPQRDAQLVEFAEVGRLRTRSKRSKTTQLFSMYARQCQWSCYKCEYYTHLDNLEQ